MSEILNAALQYAAKGWPVFPLDGKRPFRGTHGVKDATTDPDIIVEWWERWPDANVGIACGSRSADVVDIDGKKGEDALIAWLGDREIFDKGKAALNSTCISLTAKGKHLLFQYCGELKNLVRAAEDIDIRTDGGYIVAPPSIHPETGKLYQWAPGKSPAEIDLAPFPGWLIEYLQSGKPGSDGVSLFSDDVIKINSGQRHRTLVRQAASARSRGLGEPAIKAMIRELNVTQCNPPLPDNEADRIATDMAAHPPGGANDAITDLPPESAIAPIDGADRLTIQDVADVEYDDQGGIESVKFSPSRAADALRQYVHIVSTPDKTIWVYKDGYFSPHGDVEIDGIFDGVAGNAYTRHMSKETLTKIFLRTRVPFEELDKDPYLMCVNNGVVNLRTGQFMAHSPDYRMTLPVPVTFDRNAKPKHFFDFLDSACSNDDDRLTLIDWMVAISCLVEFEYILFLLGHGGNGKRVYETLLRKFFGSESTEAISLDELTREKFALGNLKRARLCISSETAHTKTATELIKKISGNDWISADVKNLARVKFLAFTQLMSDSNGMPIFEDTSKGFARRFTRVNMPFYFTDSPDPSNPLHKKKVDNIDELLSSDEEMSGILNLILLRAPEILPYRKIHRRDNDLEEYSKQSMSANEFIDMFLDIQDDYRGDSNYNVSSDFLFTQFETFCEYTVGAKLSRPTFSRLVGKANGESSMTVRVFGTDVPVRGFRGIYFDKSKFDQFIEGERNRLQLGTDSSICNSFLVTKEGGSYNETSDGRGSVTGVTDVTHYSRIKNVLTSKGSIVEPSKHLLDTVCVTTDENQQEETLPSSSNVITRNVPDTARTRPSSSTNPKDLEELLSEMERTGELYEVSAVWMAWDLELVDQRPIFEGRGWEERTPGIWYPPSRM